MASVKLKVKVTGMEQFEAAIDKAREDHPDALAAALYQKGFEIMADAKKQVPVEFAILKNSGYVAPPTGPATNPKVEAGFGTDYAEAVHENLFAFHPVGRALYLWLPFKDHVKGMLRWLAFHTRRNIKRGVGVKSIPKEAPTRPSTTGGRR